MILRILLGILFVTSLSAMDQSDSEQVSRQLYGIMIRATTIINNTSLLEDDGTFDPSEKSLLPRVQSLLSQGADPNYKLCFNVPTGPGEKFSVLLPTSIELAQKLKYHEILNLFSQK